MSILNERISTFFESSQQFYNKYILNFKSNMSISKFNKFRLYFINLIQDVKINFLNIFIQKLTEFFPHSYQIEKLINLMQISFNFWNNNLITEKIKNSIFIFFFCASCFIILKVKF